MKQIGVDEFEEPEELRKVTAGRAPTERQRREHEGENPLQCAESGVKCVFRRVSLERNTNVEGNVKLIENR